MFYFTVCKASSYESRGKTQNQEIESGNRAKAARIRYLEIQLVRANEKNFILKASKKRKLISKPKRNEKLINFTVILSIQDA